MNRVRDAMITEPRSLPATASAQAAGEVLVPPDVRAVFVVDDTGRLVGVVTRKTLVTKVVATGRDSRTVTVGEIAEPPYYTLPSDLDLDSRAILQRRLAEDEELDEPSDG